MLVKCGKIYSLIDVTIVFIPRNRLVAPKLVIPRRKLRRQYNIYIYTCIRTG